jgi:hypothetical protein
MVVQGLLHEGTQILGSWVNKLLISFPRRASCIKEGTTMGTESKSNKGAPFLVVEICTYKRGGKIV